MLWALSAAAQSEWQPLSPTAPTQQQAPASQSQVTEEDALIAHYQALLNGQREAGTQAVPQGEWQQLETPQAPANQNLQQPQGVQQPQVVQQPTVVQQRPVVQQPIQQPPAPSVQQNTGQQSGYAPLNKPVPTTAPAQPVNNTQTARPQTLPDGLPDPRYIPPEPLTPREMQFARTAWSYFEKNEHPKTGLMPSVANFKSMTLWDEGGYLLAINSAYKLGVIDDTEARRRIELVLGSLDRLKLYKKEMPNKAYNIETLEMTDYANRPKPKGIGYSALDIMRLMSGVLVSVQNFPEFTPIAQKLTQKWDFRALVNRGRFQGRVVGKRNKNGKRVQEGRIGYEQYAATTGVILGLPVTLAQQYEPILRWQPYYNIRLPGDRRTKDTHGVSAVTTSEPFLLDALEYGWRDDSFPVAAAVFNAHLLRFKKTGKLTALSEDHIKGPPYFAYNAILVDQDPFQSVTSSRKNVTEKRGISAKGSFGWWALTRHPYTNQLLEAVEGLQTDGGWMAGLFESTMEPNAIVTLNTNAVILEALHYKAHGPLYKY